MDEAQARERFARAPVAHLATADADGLPHVVALVFAVRADLVVSAVDDKPKRSTRLKRLANVRANPRVSLLVDHHEDDWDRLWWVRADGEARVVEDGPERDRAVALLVEKYPRYRTSPPTGPALLIEIRRWSWWEASPGAVT